MAGAAVDSDSDSVRDDLGSTARKTNINSALTAREPSISPVDFTYPEEWASLTGSHLPLDIQTT